MQIADKDIAQLIKKRRMKILLFRDYVNLVLWILLFLGAAWMLLTHVFLVMAVEGNDMFPALKDGDLLVGFRCQQEYRKKDVVVYTAQGKRRTGRIVAEQEDVVVVDANGVLRVNGTLQSGQMLFPIEEKQNLTYPYRVPEGCVFIIGDYPAESSDSRDFGGIPMEQVEAKVITLLRHRGV